MAVCDSTKKTDNSLAAMHLTQAAVNAANALSVLGDMDRRTKPSL